MNLSQAEYDLLIREMGMKYEIPAVEVENAIEQAILSVFPAYDIQVLFPRNGSAMRVVRYRKVDKWFPLEEALQHSPNAGMGELVAVPLSLEDGARRKFRWLLNKYLHASHTDRLYAKYSRLQGTAVVGCISRISEDGRTVFVDLGDVEAILEHSHKTPGEAYPLGLVMTFLLAGVHLRLEDKGRLVVNLSRNSLRLAEAVLREMMPGVLIKVVKRVSGLRCVVVCLSDGYQVPKKVLAAASRLLGDVFELHGDKEKKKKQKNRRRQQMQIGATA